MTVLLLDELGDFPEEDLGQIIREEARRMFHPVSYENNSGKASNCLSAHHLHKRMGTDSTFQYWARIGTSMFSNLTTTIRMYLLSVFLK